MGIPSFLHSIFKIFWYDESLVKGCKTYLNLKGDLKSFGGDGGIKLKLIFTKFSLPCWIFANDKFTIRTYVQFVSLLILFYTILLLYLNMTQEIFELILVTS